MKIRQAHLPTGWVVKKLGEVCVELFAGGDVPKDNYSDILTFEYNIPIYSNGEKNKGLYGFTNKARVVKPSITVSARGTIGYSEIRLEKFYPAIRLVVATPNLDILELSFLKYAIARMDFKSSGTSIPQLTVPMIKEYEVPIPPLSEQQRIVSVLDETFAAIEQAKANVERNLQNAKELFQSELNSIFSQKGEGWGNKSVKDACVEIFAGGDAPKDNYSNEKTEKYCFPIYANAVKDRGLYGYTDILRVTEPSITISARGSGTGHTELRYDSYFPIVRLIVLIPDKSLFSLEFLKLAIDNLVITRSGSAIPQLTVPMIKDYLIPMPTISEQHQIVERLDALSLETKKLESKYQAKLNSLEELKKSVLEKAFRGEI